MTHRHERMAPMKAKMWLNRVALFLPILSARKPAEKAPIIPPGRNMVVVSDHRNVKVPSSTGLPNLTLYVWL